MLSTQQLVRLLLLGDFFLLPVAHLKISAFGVPLYALEIPILIALLLFLFGLIRRPSSLRTLSPPDWIISFGALAFLLGAMLSFAANPFSLTGLGMLKSWFVMPMLAAFLWLQTGDTEDDTKNIFIAWAASSFLIALGSFWFLAHHLLTYDHRLEAWYTSPNFLAVLIAPGMLITAFFLSSSLSDKNRWGSFSWLASAALFLFSLILFFTHSYTVWFSVLLSLMILFSSLVAGKNTLKKILFITLLVISTGVFAFFESGTAKWHSFVSLGERSSLSSRMMIWQAAGKMIIDHPLAGIGVGRFQETYLAYQTYFPPYLEWAVPEPHSLFLAVWLSTGLIGLSGFIMLIGRTIFLLCQALRNTSDKKTSSRLALSLLVFFLIYGLADTPYFKSDLAFLFWMLIAIPMSATGRSDRAGVSHDQ